MHNANEKELFNKIRQNDKKAFELIFRRYYSNLCVFATRIIHDEPAAEEIVQDLFVGMWEKRQRIKIESSVKNYLVRSVKNNCLNYIKHNKLKEAYARHVKTRLDESWVPVANFPEPGLMEKIEESINSLPEKRREVFRLSREEGLKYREIAEKLNISIKTVETQIGLAIKTLREKLRKYKTFYTLFLIFYSK